MLRVTVRAEIRATEDPSKVEEAVRNVFSPERIDVTGDDGGRTLVASSSSYDSLERLRELLRRSRILDAAHRVLKAGIRSENRLVFHLNKQAAYVGHVSFSDPGESPLGAITFEIECNDIRGMVDWLAPRTLGGHVREYGKPEC